MNVQSIGLLPINSVMTSKLPITNQAKSIKQIASTVKEFGNEIRSITATKMGQPTKRTDQLVLEVLTRIACGESLLQVCQDTNMPGYSTFRRWEAEDPELRVAMDAAYIDHARTIDEINEDILRGGIMSTGDRLRDMALVDYNKWKLGKHASRIFGEKIQHRHTVQQEPVVLPIEATVIDAEPMEDLHLPPFGDEE